MCFEVYGCYFECNKGIWWTKWFLCYPLGSYQLNIAVAEKKEKEQLAGGTIWLSFLEERILRMEKERDSKSGT